MGYQVARLKMASGSGIDVTELRRGIARLLGRDGARFARLWMYYRNPMRVCGTRGSASSGDRPYRQGQEWGLPMRITGRRSACDVAVDGDEEVARKEVVVENDIGWRIDTMVDYLFGKPLVIRSAAPDAKRREIIDQLVRAIVAANGGILFLQQLALLGAVHGFVDVLVKLDGGCDATACGVQELGEPPVGVSGERSTSNVQHPTSKDGRSAGTNGAVGARLEGDVAGSAPVVGRESSGVGEESANPADTGASKNSLDANGIARLVRLEIVEPARALPFLSCKDWRMVDAYGQVYRLPKARNPLPNPPPEYRGRGQKGEAPRRVVGKGRWWERLLGSADAWLFGGNGLFEPRREEDSVLVVEIVTPDRWQRYEDEVLVGEGNNSLGQIPLVHIQNSAAPFEYGSSGDVEGLIPLQDELNTRLSDRANRIALQSFKMYLGKGIENFVELPVSPGRMWTSDNPDAQIIEFGGDSASPSESLHIADLREAMDKASGVSPIAAGAIKDRIGRLTSAAALRVTLMSLLARTEKKRTSYGMGIARMIELALAWLDVAGVFRTEPEERKVELHWPSPLPENEVEKLEEAEMKEKVGVAKEVVLRELGYGE